ncbi:TAP26 protein, partial [Turnix velox]|nr:TAP26 protein [Turnix velox]
GRGFAFRRKQKIERQYKKLLKKRRKFHSQQDDQFTDTYPEHLRHLYLAEEEEMLKKQHRRPDDLDLSEEKHKKAADFLFKTMRCHYTVLPQDGDDNKANACTFSYRSVTTKRNFKKKTSNQKAKEEYEKVKAERDRKKEEAEKRKQQREDAQRLYKQKKMEAYKILCKKTKKGQPNLNLQMEFLLQKIQQKT